MTTRKPKINGFNACPAIRTLSWIGIPQWAIERIMTAHGTGVKSNTMRAVFLSGKQPNRPRTGKFAYGEKATYISMVDNTFAEDSAERITYVGMINDADLKTLWLLIPNSVNVETASDIVTEIVETIETETIETETETDHNEHIAYRDVLAFVDARINVWLAGPAGSGKTTCADKVAERLDLPFYSISVGPATTQFDLLGYKNANGEYVPTLLRTAYENGGVFLIDECDAGSAECMTSINALLANGKCAFPDGVIQKHDDFIVIAAANTFGTGPDRQYVGRNQLDAATLDRFAFVEFGYDEKFEMNMVVNEFGPTAKRWVEYVQKLRHAVTAESLRIVISPRASLFGAKLLKAGMDRDKVENAVIWKGISDDDKARIIAAS